VSRAQAGWALAVLTAIISMNYLDRNVISILLDSIKKDLQLSDTVMGLVTGFSFALMYSILGIPIARLADRGNRRVIITLGLLGWSAMTMLSGVARNVYQLAVARLLVGIGESCDMAPSVSMISDYYPKEARARALSILTTGAYIGSFLGLFVGGVVNQYYGWRISFAVAGTPGILLAIVLFLSVREPLRGAAELRPPTAERLPSLGVTLRFLFTQKSLVLVLVGAALMYFNIYAFAFWTAPFLGRVHHLTSAQIGSISGTITGLCGIGGALFGGFLVERLAKRDNRWLLGIPAIAWIVATPIEFFVLFEPDTGIMWIGLAVMIFITTMYAGPIWSVTQTVAKVRMRSLAFSIFVFLNNIFGLAVSNFVVGRASDYFKPEYGNDSIRYALVIPVFVGLAAALLFAWGTRYIREDIRAAEEP